MPNYKHYRESISNELISIKDRVRDFVQHFPEDGRYKEIILKIYYQDIYPKLFLLEQVL